MMAHRSERLASPDEFERVSRRHHLHPLELLSMAWWTFRKEPGRVVIPGLVIFALDAIQATIYINVSADHHGIFSALSAFAFGASNKLAMPRRSKLFNMRAMPSAASFDEIRVSMEVP